MSQAAIDIDRAHKLYRDAIGTPFEAAARVNLVETVRRAQIEPARPRLTWLRRVALWLRGGK